ncbi:NLRC3-like protein [Labeo rohita]|uniref:NLRC3-like protein n=1 Tax=Labeo rohita TaxID=84645 RepID=A0A498LYU5_LABRO|nr:NLRC3-like protein [Labeo rohita]RXN38732.1 NLRC3-like protein [Labeo rohita]
MMAYDKERLNDILKELKKEELKEFQWHLKNHHGCITTSDMEDADQLTTVDKMVACFGPEEAVKITVGILEKIHRKDLVEQLENKHKPGSTSESSKASLFDDKEISLRLKNKLKQDYKQILIDTLSERIQSFNYGYSERKNRPSGVKIDDGSKDLGLNAIQS